MPDVPVIPNSGLMHTIPIREPGQKVLVRKITGTYTLAEKKVPQKIEEVSPGKIVSVKAPVERKKRVRKPKIISERRTCEWCGNILQAEYERLHPYCAEILEKVRKLKEGIIG